MPCGRCRIRVGRGLRLHRVGAAPEGIVEVYHGLHAGEAITYLRQLGLQERLLGADDLEVGAAAPRAEEFLRDGDIGLEALDLLGLLGDALRGGLVEG